jgi:hypothetical protein
MGLKMGSFGCGRFRQWGHWRYWGRERRQAAALQRIGLVVFICISTYTGGVARFVTKRRSAIFEKWIFDGLTRKKILFFWIFRIFCAARFGDEKRSAGEGSVDNLRIQQGGFFLLRRGDYPKLRRGKSLDNGIGGLYHCWKFRAGKTQDVVYIGSIPILKC